MVAEWESQSVILMAFPDDSTDWANIIDAARNQFARLADAIIKNGGKVVMLARNPESTWKYLAEVINDEGLMEKSITLIPLEFNDTWTRDYGPISVLEKDANEVESATAVDFGFNAWGLKFAADLDNTIGLRLIQKGVIKKDCYRNERGLILEGGSLETDGEGTMLTTSECLLNVNRNPGLSKHDIEKYLYDILGIDRVLWLDHGHIDGDDTDSHIDTLCRLAPGNTILYTGSTQGSNGQRESLKKMEQQLRTFQTRGGNPYNLLELPLPKPIKDDDGHALGATYANFLVMTEAVLVPTYGDKECDDKAIEVIKQAYPDRKIIGVDCRTLIMQGGSLHCSTMQIIPGLLNENFEG